jgi:hypothetical protein
MNGFGTNMKTQYLKLLIKSIKKNIATNIMEFYNTWKTQIEILPRFSTIYGKGHEEDGIEITSNGLSIEWLWFGVFFSFGDE